MQAPDTLPEDPWKQEPWAASEATAGKVEFRRWDGALPLKAAGAPAEQQTQHGIAETRFENSQQHGALFCLCVPWESLL